MRLSQEQFYSLNQILKMGIIPAGRSGRRAHFSTLLRWIKNGLKDPQGRRIRLEAVRVGGKWATSLEALERFFDALTPKETQEAVRWTSNTNSRNAERAGKKLDAFGL